MKADEAPSERLHPIALLSGFGKALRNLFGGFAAGGYLALQGRAAIGIMVIGGMIGVSLVGLLLRWWRFSYRVGDDAVRIDSGILSRNHRTIPFDRVQDVSISQGPLQRLLGVAEVTLETGSSTAGKEEGLLAAVALGRAEALRAQVRAARGLARPATRADDPVPDTAPAEPRLFAMDARRVLTLGLFNFSLALFAGLFGASQTVGDLFDVDPFERKFWRPLLVDSGLGDWLLSHRLGLILSGLAVLTLAGMLTGVIRTLLREWGFTLDRTGHGLRRRRGLLTRTDVTLPLARIQAGVIATGPVRDRFGWRRLAVESLASDLSEGKQAVDHVLAPLADDGEVAVILKELDWSPPGPATAWHPVSRAHVTVFCIALLPVFPLLLLLWPLRWHEWKRTAFALEGGRLLLRTGWWRRRTLILPIRHIESVDITENALTRRYGIASLMIGSPGGPARGHRLPSLPRKEASELRRQLLSRPA